LVVLTCLVLVAAVLPALAQEKPRHGGELVFVVAAEPPSFDGHREETFAMLHPIAPHYNTLLRTDPTDRTGTKFIGDLAESWTVSADKRTFGVWLIDQWRQIGVNVKQVNLESAASQPLPEPAARRGLARGVEQGTRRTGPWAMPTSYADSSTTTSGPTRRS
jgi:ABC-type transport system substrate-binding protein